MAKLSRRRFLQGLAGLGLGALAGGGVFSELACARASTLPPRALPSHAREAMFYEPLTRASVRCQLCPRRCVIAPDQRGNCRVRENRSGKLYTMVYGNPCAVSADPIEKKPFFHFLPGSEAYSLATAGCNLHCLYCQNWHISQMPPEETDNRELPPEKAVEEARDGNCSSIAYTYSEPIVFYEYMLAMAQLAKEKGIKNVVVTSGYINPQPLRNLCQVVDAIKVDLKGFTEDFYERVCEATLEPVLRALEVIVEEGVHLEIVNLVVPTLNDGEEDLRGLAQWIRRNLGPDVPTHFIRFLPEYKLDSLPPTPVETLTRAQQIAQAAGLNYVYVGNLPGHKGENTYCAHCGEPLILRMGFTVMLNHIEEGKCIYCGNSIPGIWD